MSAEGNDNNASDAGLIPDIDFDDLLPMDPIDSNKRPAEDEGDDVAGDAGKRLKTDDLDPLAAVFTDLPEIGVPADSLGGSVAASPAPGAAEPAQRKPSAADVRQQPAPQDTAKAANAAGSQRKTSKASAKKDQKGATVAAPSASASASASALNLPAAGVNGGPKGLGPGQPKEKGDDPDKMSDAVLAAGIDLKAEESLLAVANQNKITTMTSAGGMTPQRLHDLKQMGGFMNKVISENALAKLTTSKLEIVELVQFACEDFMKDIITNSVIYSRHRRRPLKSKHKSSSTQRSDVSRALRDLAVKDKEAEEKRMKKREALGMDGGDDKGEKAGVEETLHRAANATAAMMMAGPKKKKYSWMTGSGGSGNGVAGAGNGSTNAAVAARGDSGIRYREAREEPNIVIRDFVAALETKRIGVDRTLTKAYSRL